MCGGVNMGVHRQAGPQLPAACGPARRNCGRGSGAPSRGGLTVTMASVLRRSDVAMDGRRHDADAAGGAASGWCAAKLLLSESVMAPMRTMSSSWHQ